MKIAKGREGWGELVENLSFLCCLAQKKMMGESKKMFCLLGNKSIYLTFLQMINIDVYSDLSCPWCYVGKRRLDKAIQQFTSASVTANWHPYIIDKRTAAKGEEYMAYNMRRYNIL